MDNLRKTTVPLDNIYDILDRLKQRRAMFLGNEHTFQSLHSFINGYMLAGGIHKVNENGLPDFSCFNTWLLGHLKKHYGEAGGWHWQISNRNPDNDEKAFEEFFHYLELFKKSKSSSRLIVLNDDATRFNNDGSIKRARLLWDGEDDTHEVPVARPVTIRRINMENSKTVWIEFIDKDNNIINDSWFINAKKATKSLIEKYGELTNAWIENNEDK
ncbi:MAG: hypothetical protein JWQ57_2613 [Mucilaginibacter sp.]|nr:hypothetical protein [Mucilaginibacter sp.]